MGLIKNCVMDANREMELAELRKEIKEAKEEKTKALTAGQVSLAEKVQDQINKLEDQKFFLMQQLGESQPPENRKFCSCMAK